MERPSGVRGMTARIAAADYSLQSYRLFPALLRTMPHQPASKALAHIKVLDLSRVRAGPTCVKQFADFGADVIKIETPPELERNAGMLGDRHGPDMQNLHRNKRSMTLNLKDPK